MSQKVNSQSWTDKLSEPVSKRIGRLPLGILCLIGVEAHARIDYSNGDKGAIRACFLVL